MSFYHHRYHHHHYYPSRPKVSISEFKKNNKDIDPVEIEGRTIAKTFWGQRWCHHFENMADFDNRLPRGRTYVRQGTVVHLEINPGQVLAKVAGSDIYTIDMKVAPLPADTWEKIKSRCHGSVKTILDLMMGQFSSDVMEVVCDPSEGLFPNVPEIKYDCSCPDYAKLCKHVAATFYAIGNRLDRSPELLFLLRRVNPRELLYSGTEDLTSPAAANSEDVLDGDLSSIFGIDLAPLSNKRAGDQASLPSTKGASDQVSLPATKSARDQVSLSPPRAAKSAKAQAKPTSQPTSASNLSDAELKQIILEISQAKLLAPSGDPKQTAKTTTPNKRGRKKLTGINIFEDQPDSQPVAAASQNPPVAEVKTISPSYPKAIANTKSSKLNQPIVLATIGDDESEVVTLSFKGNRLKTQTTKVNSLSKKSLKAEPIPATTRPYHTQPVPASSEFYQAQPVPAASEFYQAEPVPAAKIDSEPANKRGKPKKNFVVLENTITKSVDATLSGLEKGEITKLPSVKAPIDHEAEKVAKRIAIIKKNIASLTPTKAIDESDAFPRPRRSVKTRKPMGKNAETAQVKPEVEPTPTSEWFSSEPLSPVETSVKQPERVISALDLQQLISQTVSKPSKNDATTKSKQNKRGSITITLK
jgi:uncharacterized Zn finger protein